MTSVNENIKRLEELSQEDGTGGLLVCYETGREKPHADSSYQLYPVNPDQKGMTYQFLSLLHVGVETARISAFIPDTRMEVYRFPRMSDLPPFYRDTPVKEYITGMLLPHIKKNRLKPVVSVNLRDMVFIRSEGLSVEPGGILRLDAGQIDRLVEFRRRQDELAARYKYIPGYKLPLRVIETPKGVLVFSGSDIGRKGTENFYKFLLDNYFRCMRLPVPSGNTAWIHLPTGYTDSPTSPAGKSREQTDTRSTFSTHTPVSERRKRKDGFWSSPRTWLLPIRNTAWRTSPATGRKGTIGISSGCSPCRSISTGPSFSIRLSPTISSSRNSSGGWMIA